MIDIAQIVAVSEVNGPGKRAVIWVQGCHKRCPGCWNQDYLKFGSVWQLTAQELFQTVKQMTANFRDVEGITFSGGEPFDQAEALEDAAVLFKENNLTVMSYSGYTLEEIQQNNKVQSKLLAALDILVDGEYVKELHCDRLWRSSLNQKVHFLSDHYKSFEDLINADVREFEVVLSANETRVTGFPSADLIRRI
ncbi:radical SAM protein [bacterium]|nr:radical SAM protein [bacterium]